MLGRISDADPTPLRVVVVTLDFHLASVVERAARTLQRTFPGLTLTLHAAAAWSDPAALARSIADIETADIVVVSMLFMEDHVRAVMPALTARRDACDAMVCLMSAGEVTRLTRMGRFSVADGGGPLTFLKRLRGKSPSQGGGADAGARQMKMLRRLPKILRFIPGTAQDVRAYFLTLQYWLAGSEDNVVNLVRMLVDRYADGPRKRLRGTHKAAAPVEYPEVGVYHPRLAPRIAESADRLPAATAGSRGTVGMLVMRSYLLAGNTGHYDGVITAMEAAGLRVIPAFACGLDARPAIDRFFVRDGRPVVDAVVSLTGFSLVGGPAYNDAPAAEDDALPSPRRSLRRRSPRSSSRRSRQWHGDDRGLHPHRGHHDGGDPRARWRHPAR